MRSAAEVAVTAELGRRLHSARGVLGAGERREHPGALALELASVDRPIEIYRKDGLFRLHVGPYRTRAEAAATAEKVRDTLDVRPHVVVR